HNPRCSKSRQTLQLLAARGIEPEITLYLEQTPDAAELKELLAMLGMSARDLLRKGEDAYKTNNLKDPALDDEQLIAAMVQHPKLIERPIVVSNGKAALGRPPERVLEIL
ncbi:MAG: arsenate reductase (glutaredoxin), partial [Halioglobus sp.]|nr:arsenate reductase (glutaredoxin) [Halioglobus sp.]